MFVLGSLVGRAQFMHNETQNSYIADLVIQFCNPLFKKKKKKK